ncbi:MAG: C2 family cysteine protease [Dokdonia sp.]|jgi:hypothetical protein
MVTHADKAQEHISQPVSNDKTQIKGGSESTFQFVDNRPEVMAQRKLQGLTNTSPKVQRAAQLQAMANQHTYQQQKLIQRRENNTGLPDSLKSGIEGLSGYAMDDVQVHYNSDKPAQLQALAFAQGTDIHLASGQEKHLPHEAWHIVQQKQGRVKPTIQMKANLNINDDTSLEREADIMGLKALNYIPVATKQTSYTTIDNRKNTSQVVQRVFEYDDQFFEYNKDKIEGYGVYKERFLFKDPLVWDIANEIRSSAKIPLSQEDALHQATSIEFKSGEIKIGKNLKKVWVKSDALKQIGGHTYEIALNTQIWKKSNNANKDLLSKHFAITSKQPPLQIELDGDEKTFNLKGLVDGKYWVLDGDIYDAKFTDAPLDLDTWDPQPEDIQQGSVGDCFLLAPLLAILRTNKQLVKDLFVSQTEDDVVVKLYDGEMERVIKIKKTSVVTHDQKDKFALKSSWVQLLEKAYVAFFNKGNFNDLNEGGLGREALARLTGKKSSSTSGSGGILSAAKIAKKLEVNMVVIGHSNKFIAGVKEGLGHSAGEVKVQGLAQEHAYAVIGVYQGKKQEFSPKGIEGLRELPDSKGDFVLLGNPWGRYGRTYSATGDKEGNESEMAGTFWLKYDEFKQDFQYISHTIKGIKK